MYVLVADDDPDIREFVTDALAWDNHEVLVAGNGLEALRLLDAHRPDVILLDLRMPVMDGPTFARCCWERFGHEIPIIVMSAHINDVPFERFPVAGFLAKPFDLKHLSALVERFGNRSP